MRTLLSSYFEMDLSKVGFNVVGNPAIRGVQLTPSHVLQILLALLSVIAITYGQDSGVYFNQQKSVQIIREDEYLAPTIVTGDITQNDLESVPVEDSTISDVSSATIVGRESDPQDDVSSETVGNEADSSREPIATDLELPQTDFFQGEDPVTAVPALPLQPSEDAAQRQGTIDIPQPDQAVQSEQLPDQLQPVQPDLQPIQSNQLQPDLQPIQPNQLQPDLQPAQPNQLPPVQQDLQPVQPDQPQVQPNQLPIQPDQPPLPPVVAPPPAPTPPPVAAPPPVVTPPPVAAPPPVPPDPPQPVGPDGECFARTCDQAVTGRQLTYSRALEIVQNEEYLDDADLGIIRKRRLKRLRRQAVQSTGRQRQNGSTGLPAPDLPGFPSPDSPAEPPPAPSSNGGQPMDVFAPIVSTGWVMTIATMGTAVGTNPIIAPGQIPPGNPLPGTLGGGAVPPATADGLLGQAYALLPLGAIPVSVFPPYINPRTFEAESVIFYEPGQPLIAARRSDYSSQPQQNDFKSNLRSFFLGLSNTARYVASSVRCYFLRSGLRILEMRSNFRRGDGRGTYGSYGYGNVPVRPIDDPKTARLRALYQDQCEPKYGFITVVRLVEEQPCTGSDARCRGLPITFDEVMQSFFESTVKKRKKRQTGEEFVSAGPVDCRIARRAANFCL